MCFVGDGDGLSFTTRPGVQPRLVPSHGQNKDLLAQALVHPSFTPVHPSFTPVRPSVSSVTEWKDFIAMLL